MTATASYSPATCPRCGRSMPIDAPAGLCPQCLLSDGFGAQSEPTGRFTGKTQPRFVPPTIEELAQEFPQLNFVQLLGAGGMGAVYLANQVRLARPVAVKILPPDLADDAAFAERFLREARALARLSHPNIVGVFDFGQTPGGLYYFLMEYIEGPTLRQVVANRSAEPKQALEIVRQVCDALQYAHDKGVVHRDIKPENVLLDSHGRVKIADFGLAKLLGLAETAPGSPAAGSLTGTRQAMGTPHYMAPEQIMGSRSVDHRADIYSLGVVFYELLTGELPLGRFAAPSKKVQIDVRLDDVVLRTLEAEPAQRYQRAGDVKTDVETISFAPPPTNAAANGGAGATAFHYFRDAKQSASHTARTILERAAGGTTSRKVLTAWACVIVAALCVMFIVAAGAIGGAEAAVITTVILGWVGLGSAIAASVIAISTIGEIRRSEGRLTGLVQAVAVALVIPFVMLDIAIWCVCLIPGFIASHQDGTAYIIATLLAVPASVLVDFCVLRMLWRWAIRGLSPERVERELSVIPPEFREFGAQVGAFLDKVLRALKPIQRSDGWSSAPRRTPQPAARRTPPQPMPVAEEDRPILRPADDFEDSVPQDFTPRVSRKALIGGVWLAWIPLATLFFLISVANQRNDAVEIPMLALGAVCALPATVAPFLTTMLGWLAIGDIRRSSGRLVGLPLAVFDGLCFPLLLLDAVIAAAAMAATGVIAWAIGRNGPSEVVLVAPLGLLVALVAIVIVDTLIVRTVWRRIRPAKRFDSSVAGVGESPSEARVAPSTFMRRHRELIAAGAALGVVACLLFLKAAHDGRWFDVLAGGPGSPRPISAPEPPTLERSWPIEQTVEAVEDTKRRWRFGPRGPELSPGWAMMVGISRDTKDRIDDVLQNVYADYQRLLDEHVAAQRTATGVQFQIAAFPSELESLSNRFWSEIDPSLTREQQSIMRYNFPLRWDDDRRTYSTDDFNKTLMLFGSHDAVVTIEPSGQWYRWSTSSPINWGSMTPELPHFLAGWNQRMNSVMALPVGQSITNLRRIPVIAPKPAEASWVLPAPAGPDAGYVPPAAPGY